MTDTEMIEELLAACKAYHAALDLALAKLIEVSHGRAIAPFMPSQSPMWPALVNGHRVMVEAEAALNRRAGA